MTWPRNILRRYCPFCDWYLDDAGPTIDTDAPVLTRGKTPTEAIQDHVAAVFRAHDAKVEQVLQDHIDTHVEEMTLTPP